MSLHVPHDDVHGIATAQLANGTEVTVITTSRDSQVLQTSDEGLSWRPVFGEGLELARADTVIWDSHPSAQKFIIGSDYGFWTFDPITGDVEEFNLGLPADNSSRYACQIVTPSEGNYGPVFMINQLGQIWVIDHTSSRWKLTHETGIADPRGQLAIVRDFDITSTNARLKSLAASVAGILYVSEDGGVNWRKHPQFLTQATRPEDPLITAISFASDYEHSGNVVLATSEPEKNSFSSDRGTIYQSGDFGDSFQSVAQFKTSIRAIVSTPVGPSGNRWFLASGFAHPRANQPGKSIGILRSQDGGLTWSDYGSRQDFVQEVDSAETVPGNRALLQDFEVMPDFATSGRIYFGRSEGLYCSNDEGWQWIRRSYRPSSQVRGVDSLIDNAGDLVAFSGGYGTGTLRSNLNTGEVDVLSGGTNNYVHSVKLSPSFNQDGMLIVGGSRGPSIWYDPEIGAPNVHNVLGWKSISLGHHLGYVRGIAYSPRFDARAVAGSDQVVFFSTSSELNTNFVSPDAGRSVLVLDKLTDGTPAPFMRYLAVAPSYDSTKTTGRVDVYGAHGKTLYRLKGSKWEPIFKLPRKVQRMVIAPDFDRDATTPGLPRLFFALQSPPYFVEYVDDYRNPTLTEYSEGMEQGYPVAVACPPDFASSQTVYLATFSSGVKKLDLTQPLPQWQPVGVDFPDLWISNLTLSPNFAQDKTVIVGSQDGVIYCKDTPAGKWQSKIPPTLRDNEAPEFHLYQPGLPGNPDDLRTSRWDINDTFSLRETTSLELIDTTVFSTSNNGSYLDCAEYAGGVKLHTFSGPDCGEVIISAENYWTGAPLGSKTVDLSGQYWENASVSLSFTFQPVRIRVEAKLDKGESFHFDGMTFGPR